MNLFTQFTKQSVEQLDPAQVKNRQGKIYLLDVRQPEEYRLGHIPGAKLVPLNQLGSRLQSLPRDREIVCICRSGNRSAAAARQLSAAGYKALNLRGGMIAWTRQGFPVKQGSA